MAIIDVFTYNGEADMLALHIGALYPYVDKFLIVEAKTTFSGNKKPLYYSKHERVVTKWWPKIEYYIIDENYSPEEVELAQQSPNTQGARHWKTEFLQKESIQKALKHIGTKDDDIVFIGDVDEIWNPTQYWEDIEKPLKLKLDVYAYWLNNHSNEQFWGTTVSKYAHIKNEVLNHVRTNSMKSSQTLGWHFTSMGGFKEVQRKLNDSYTPESYNTAEVQALLKQRLDNKQDFLGRNFTFTIDETHWPLYLKQNRAKFSHLLYGTHTK